MIRTIREQRYGLMGYSHRAFICPYFQYDIKLGVKCEGGKINFKDRDHALGYENKYCGSYDWKHCSVAQALNIYYEEQDE